MKKAVIFAGLLFAVSCGSNSTPPLLLTKHQALNMSNITVLRCITLPMESAITVRLIATI